MSILFVFLVLFNRRLETFHCKSVLRPPIKSRYLCNTFWLEHSTGMVWEKGDFRMKQWMNWESGKGAFGTKIDNGFFFFDRQKFMSFPIFSQHKSTEKFSFFLPFDEVVYKQCGTRRGAENFFFPTDFFPFFPQKKKSHETSFLKNSSSFGNFPHERACSRSKQKVLAVWLENSKIGLSLP